MVKEFQYTEIGKIPSDWHLATYGECFDFLTTATYSRAQLSDKGEIGYVHYGDIHVKFHHFIDFKKITLPTIDRDLLKYYSPLKEGDVIVADASEDYEGVGKSVEVRNLSNKIVISGLHTFLLRDNKGLIANGFKGYIHSNNLVKKQIDTLATGLKVYGISKTNLKKTLIPLPPTKAEQTAIATALNDVDALIENLEQLLAKKRNINNGVRQELLMPKAGWINKLLGEVVDINMGQSPASKYYNTNQLGLPLLQGNADLNNRKQLIRFWTSQITKTCDAGDIIMTVRAPVGSIGVAQQNSCIGRGVCSFKMKNAIKEFIYHLLIFKESDWKVLEQGSTFTSANSNQIYGFNISIPKDLNIQANIARTLSDLDLEIHVLEGKILKYKMIKQGMMQSLLTGKIRLV